MVWRLIFVVKKATKGTELQLLCTQGTLKGGRVEDCRMMFTGHLHLPQLYFQAILYIYKTDYVMSSTLHTLTSVWGFSILSSVHFPNVLARWICSTTKRFFSWLSFPLFSWALYLIQGWYWKEKLDASHSQGLKC